MSIIAKKSLRANLFFILSGLLLVSLSFFNVAHAQKQDIHIKSYVDIEEINFGASLVLTIETTTKLIGRGQQLSVNPPQIDSIPNFDILSTRRASQTQIVNGVGHTTNAIVYELVPQSPGTHIIPAFIMTDSSGKTYETEPISIKVNPPPSSKPQKTETFGVPQADKQSTTFSSILFAALLLSIGIAVFIFLGILSKTSSKKTDNSIEDAVIISETITKSEPQTIKKTNFADEILTLTRQHPEVNKEFYEKYFVIFKAALCRSDISEDMTLEEILNKVSTENPSLKEQTRKLSNDIDIILYSGNNPTRAFSQINEDAQAIIKAIS